ncbi:hypothetical protein RA955_06850 [Geobacillus proteiniphilus]|uniref:Uncharacterized protein n=1 Tax=Geobacillus proteiniphilus TaxID=860353 RepID=A0A1Q5SYY6_9BACL|nr:MULTISPECIES: hypothetical protein [Geobacillus]MED4972089.1 hypothetical protein [Geobacillus thermoleovorans]OKO93170.1 hypothetical protein BRO54_2002 [Geobacillus proteiniphilus]OPX04438.1 hypothetical protein B1A75_03050 [Geobacillus sp. LEMMY01]QCK82188.1 hypothetical protein E5Z46_07895 [Geobacillus kaustophilus NBRC 102445]WMJ17758.1 hypothetical protein RA955_06850 [Geobacillus proteiniphilus]
MKNKNDQHLRLQQQIIHYRSEAASYRQQVQQLEAELAKEKMRSAYLKEKLREAETTNVETYKKKIAALERQLLLCEIALEEAEHNVSKRAPTSDLKQTASVLALFHYSVIVPTHLDEEELTIIGDFIIRNHGTAPLHHLIICLRLSPPKTAVLSGKIILPNSVQAEQEALISNSAESWTFTQENWREKVRQSGEYWLAPLYDAPLEPGGERRFSQFEITVRPSSSTRSLTVDGFVYCAELPKGVPAANHITIQW